MNLVCICSISSLQALAVTQKVSKRKRGTEDLSAPSILEHLKDNLKCSEHRGANIWCWVDRNTSTAQHVPLCLHDIQLWVKYLVCKSI